MRTLSKYFLFLLVLNGLSGKAISQVNAEDGAGITTTIIEPVTLTKTVNTDFGNLTLIIAGTIEMTPVRGHLKKGSLVLPVATGTFTAAIYTFSGSAGSYYTVSYRASPFTIRSGSNSIQVASFDPVFSQGSNLIAGVYVSVTPSNVTVNYN